MQFEIKCWFLRIITGVIQCGTVTCPPNSYQCTVTKQSYDNNEYVQMTNTCTNNAGTKMLYRL